MKAYVFQMPSFSQVSPPKPRMHLSCPPHVPHAPPISFFLIWSPEQHLRRTSDPEGWEAPRFQDNLHMKVVRLSALRTGRLYSPGNIPATHLGSRTHDLPACSAVSQRTAPPRDPRVSRRHTNHGDKRTQNVYVNAVMQTQCNSTEPWGCKPLQIGD